MKCFIYPLIIISIQIYFSGFAVAQDTAQQQNASTRENTLKARKITQARMAKFKENEVIVYALEEFNKPPKLVFQKDDVIKYSFEFDSTFRSGNVFGFTGHSFLRYKEYDIKGMPSPLVMGVSSQAGGSNTQFQIVLVAEIEGKICSINPKDVTMSTQDGIFLGYINKEFQYGMILWNFIWDSAHYDTHKYDITIYKWNRNLNKFVLCKKFSTNNKFKNGEKALRYYNLPYKNFRDDIILGEGELSTLGIEDYLLNSK